MADTTATLAGSTYPVYSQGWAHSTKTAHGSVASIATGPTIGDRFKMVRLPKGAVIVGGHVTGTKMESSTSGALLDMDIGVDMGGTVDTDQLGNFGVWNAAAVTGIKPEVGYSMPLGGLLLTTGPVTCTGDYNDVYITVVASALVFSTGSLNLTVHYY
jgi:hypothetical protein